jgi:hypothetical protein
MHGRFDLRRAFYNSERAELEEQEWNEMSNGRKMELKTAF